MCAYMCCCITLTAVVRSDIGPRAFIDRPDRLLRRALCLCVPPQMTFSTVLHISLDRRKNSRGANGPRICMREALCCTMLLLASSRKNHSEVFKQTHSIHMYTKDGARAITSRCAFVGAALYGVMSAVWWRSLAGTLIRQLRVGRPTQNHRRSHCTYSIQCDNWKKTDDTSRAR